jgi:hypothetical protein
MARQTVCRFDPICGFWVIFFAMVSLTSDSVQPVEILQPIMVTIQVIGPGFAIRIHMTLHIDERALNSSERGKIFGALSISSMG